MIAKYQPPGNGWLDNQVAVTVHGVGSGMVYTVGAYLDETAQLALIEHIARIAGQKPLKAPAGIEIRTRLGAEGQEIYFVINHTRSEQTVFLPWLAREHLADVDIQPELKLPPYGAAVLTKREG